MADWNPLYGKWDRQHQLVSDKPLANIGLTAEAYKAQIGVEEHTPALKAASDWGGTPMPVNVLSVDDFKQIVVGASVVMGMSSGSEAQVKSYLSSLSEAFRIFRIDTVQAQALFLAHGAGETKFARFTEGQTKNFVDDPSQVEIGMETGVDTKKRGGPTRYAGDWYVNNGQKDQIDPSGVIWLGGPVPTAPGKPASVRPPMDAKDFDKTFIGRAPLQVTFGWAYVQTLVYVDAMREIASAADAQALTNLYDKVRTDPTEAARAENTFLFAAAYMHMSGMVRRSPWGFTTAGMSGGHDDAQKDPKAQTYNNAVAFLTASAGEYKRATGG